MRLGLRDLVFEDETRPELPPRPHPLLDALEDVWVGFDEKPVVHNDATVWSVGCSCNKSPRRVTGTRCGGFAAWVRGELKRSKLIPTRSSGDRPTVTVDEVEEIIFGDTDGLPDDLARDRKDCIPSFCNHVVRIAMTKEPSIPRPMCL